MSVFSRYFFEGPKNDLQEQTFKDKKNKIISLIKVSLIHFIGNIQQGIEKEREISPL